MDPSSGTAPPSQGTKQSSNNRSPRLSVLEPDIRSPSGSFTWMSKQAKAPGTLLLGSPEQEVYGRKSCISISDSITSPTGRQSPCSPRLAKQEDPMHAWPNICNASPEGAAAGLTGSSNITRSPSPGDSLSPRRHSFTAPQHPRSSSIVAAVLPSSLSVSGISSSATCSHGGADSTEWLQGVRTSISGGNNMCSDSGRLRSDSGRMRRDSELMAQQASSKAQLVAASELSLQRQTHAALQRLSIKQLTKESEDQPLQHTPHK